MLFKHSVCHLLIFYIIVYCSVLFRNICGASYYLILKTYYFIILIVSIMYDFVLLRVISFF